MARLMSLILVASCAICSSAVVPALAGAQPGSEDEYSLDLPGSGANGDTPASGSDSTAGGSDSSDSGGFPIVVVILIAGAGVAAGIAAWRLRKPQPPDEQA